MICGLTRITQEQLEIALKNKNEVDKLLDEGPEPDAPYETHNLLLDKSWDGIHFLLTGKKNLLRVDTDIISFALGGEKTIDASDATITTYVTADKVARVAEALKAISKEEFASRYNENSLKKNDIYPSFVCQKDNADYLVDFFGRLKKFYQETAKEGKAMLISTG